MHKVQIEEVEEIDPRRGGGWKWARVGEKRNWYFAEHNVRFFLVFLIHILYFRIFCLFLVYLTELQNCQVMATSSSWRCSWSPNCCSSCNIWGKRREGVIMGDKGVVNEGDGMVFVRGLGEGQMSRLMRAGIVVWRWWWCFWVDICW